MKLVGLTGGIGTGKSTAAAFLARRGLRVVDTDVIAREIVEPGQPALQQIGAVFGSELIDDHGRLRRTALAELVFADPAKRRQLEAILHPLIRARWLRTVAEWRRGDAPVAVVVIPLLFETKAEGEFDLIACTACSAATQRERLSVRGWSSEQILQRIAAQWPLEQKIAAADRVIWTEGSLEMHERQLSRLF